ncbi:lipase 3-like [Phymastichus coffea]|uniref:lipase 3-like n=1 Tax=Phymastichus coffea TaxID=108790 RepID=UPI00273B9AE8|nr:lipase 3-like [Phymastichus coffea]
MSLLIVLYVSSIFLTIADHCDTYNGPIAGNKNISECINGGKTKSSGLDVTPYDFIKNQGYPAEDHFVLTKDGYILTLNRIPGPPNASVVLLHHGFPATSFDWIVLGKNRALAFLLADQGYDVWLGNSRGGLYSACHVKYTTSEYSFWNFSFHEIAVYDLPAEINYIEKIRDHVDMYYIGHSMGATISYIMVIERPELTSKFKILIGLAPVGFLGHAKGILPFFAPFATLVEPIINYSLAGEIFQQTKLKDIMQKFCILSQLTEQLCLFFRFTVFGIDFSQIDYEIVPLNVHHGFVPSAFKIAVHYAQLIVSGKFRQYDYGFLGNLKSYHSFTPPDYELSRIQTPVGLIWAENDLLATSEDVIHLYSKIPTVMLYHKINYSRFNHLDFVHAKNASELVYTKVISVLKNIENHL